MADQSINQSNDDKPFKCSKCSQGFSNSDHLNVHQAQHQKQGLRVKMPAGVTLDNIADQTPTPTRFLKTADVEGSQLFEEIDPFDQYFKLASKRQDSNISTASSTSNQNSSAGATSSSNQNVFVRASSTNRIEPASSTANENASSSNDKDDSSEEISSTSSIVDMTQIIERKAVGVVSSSNVSDSSSTHRVVVVKKQKFSGAPLVSSTTNPKPTVHVFKHKQSLTNLSSTTIPLANLSSTTIPLANLSTTTIPLTSLSSTSLTSKQTTSQDKSAVSILQTVLQQIKTQQNTSLSQPTVNPSNPVESKTSQPLSQQDAIREQLASLINSGQIKIQFTSDPSSPKVQATIVGTLAKTNQPINQQPAETFKYQQKIPISRTPSAGVTPTFLTLPTQVQSPLTPMSIFSTGSMVKQKLKESIQHNNDNNNGMSSRISMVQHGGSNQGKYKDIILDDEFVLSDDGMGGKRKRSFEDSSPDDKRRRFLERNRAAASRCRQKRKIWVNQLEKKSDNLVSTNSHLMTEITSLRAEVAQLKALLIAHKDCPVTLQQKALLGQIVSSAGAYVTVSGGQIIAIHHDAIPSNGVTSAEEVATSALTDMADRATIELANHVSSGTVTIQTSDGSLPSISSDVSY